jgi:bifunctional aspartokinase / homoserine dehydrogenase 1
MATSSTDHAAWVVHKFGGTSVANADRYRNAARIVGVEPGARKAVVVSAMSGVTDALLSLVGRARRRDGTYLEALEALRQKHFDAARQLLPETEAARLEAVFRADARDLADILRAVWLGRSASELTEELVSGYGEVWSAQLLHAHLRAEGVDCAWIDAREVLVVHPGELGPRIDQAVSSERLGAFLEAHPSPLVVITGFVAATPEGVPTTLKRNGSDFSASIFGALLDAREIVIWTDVDGVLSADPRRVPEARLVPEMSYDEACELAYFGAKVLHPRTMEPAVARAIPIRIRNSFNSEHPGSVIRAASSIGPRDVPVSGFSTYDRVALVNVEGTGMIGVPGVAQRIFGALREVGVSVILISQASSEHSVCFAVPEAQAASARDAVERAFERELTAGQLHRVELVHNVSILAAVGDGMARSKGVAARFFAALSKASVNVRAIAQGSSERNLSVVIDAADASRALRAVHAAFYLSERVLSLGVVGPGQVGRALLTQLAEQLPVLHDRFRLDLRLMAVADSKKMLLSERGLAPDEALAALARDGVPVDLEAFAAHVGAPHLPHAAIVDCSASEGVADNYAAWLARGVHVVTPNKRAGAGPVARYKALRDHGRARGRHWLYEATVGAGLPVITTLRDMVQTGDRVERIEGVLSGTLSYVFNRFDGTTPFSEVVRDARAKGYTEPDPRDDLSGVDVARKLVILAREMGVEIELGDVEVESLVPADAADAKSPEDFLDQLRASDDAMADRVRAARASGHTLRYVGVVDASGKARVSLSPYADRHAFSRLAETDNIFAFTTARYPASRPLIVQGPGAGPAVTAGGVFADILRLASWLSGASV